jgi:rRNA processing protein Gar1
MKIERLDEGYERVFLRRRNEVGLVDEALGPVRQLLRDGIAQLARVE